MKSFGPVLGGSELGSCVKVEVAFVGNEPGGFCGRKATLKVEGSSAEGLPLVSAVACVRMCARVCVVCVEF